MQCGRKMSERPQYNTYVVGEFIRKGAVAQRVVNKIIERHKQLQKKKRQCERRKAKEAK
jgi:hypothetical protein